MIDILNGPNTQGRTPGGGSVITTVNKIPAPTDISNVTFKILHVNTIRGNVQNDYFGKIFQFKYDSTEVITSSHINDKTYRYNIDLLARTISFLGTIPHGGGMVSSDNFKLMHGFSPAYSVNAGTRKSGTRFEWDGTTYINTGTANLSMKDIESYTTSSSGSVLFDSYTVIRLNSSGTYDTLITSNKLLLGAVCSEDEKTIVTIDKIAFAINTYKQQVNGTYELVSTTPFNLVHAFPTVATNTGIECAHTSDLSTIVLPTSSGAVIFKYNTSSSTYDIAQTIPFAQYNNTKQTSVSMCRTGEFLVVMYNSKNPTIYRIDSAGVYVYKWTLVTTVNCERARISPDGKLFGCNDIALSDTRGMLYVYTIF